MTSIALRSARGQAAAIRSREISATELLDVTIDRYERPNPTINAVIATQFDVARGRATDADAATARGESSGPLHGVAARSVRMSHWEWAALHAEREFARLASDAFFGDDDALLCPTASTAAYPHDQEGERADGTVTVNGREQLTTDQLCWAGLSCGVYLPGTVATAGFSASGLTCGLQIVTGHLRDREGIAFAELIERELGGYVAPPGYDEEP